jgi:hypothetical protein
LVALLINFDILIDDDQWKFAIRRYGSPNHDAVPRLKARNSPEFVWNIFEGYRTDSAILIIKFLFYYKNLLLGKCDRIHTTTCEPPKEPLETNPPFSSLSSWKSTNFSPFVGLKFEVILDYSLNRGARRAQSSSQFSLRTSRISSNSQSNFSNRIWGQNHARPTRTRFVGNTASLPPSVNRERYDLKRDAIVLESLKDIDLVSTRFECRLNQIAQIFQHCVKPVILRLSSPKLNLI